MATQPAPDRKIAAGDAMKPWKAVPMVMKRETRTPTATARRLRKLDRVDLESELIIVCPDCGDSFSIVGQVPCLDSALARSRGAWLLDQFVWDHIQENKHKASITLPDL